MKRKRKLLFDRIIKDIQIEKDNIVDVSIVPGYSVKMPSYNYKVVTEGEILTALYTTILMMQRKGKDIYLVSTTLREHYNEIIVRANEIDFLEFCKNFTLLLSDDIENIRI